MRECDKYRDEFSDYVDGEMAPEGRRVLEAHLAICPECHKILDQIRGLRERLQGLSLVKTSPLFNQRLRQRISARGGRGFARERWPLHLDWKIPALGSAVVVMLVVLLMVFNTDSAVSPQMEQPQRSGFSTTPIPGSEGDQGAYPQQAAPAAEAESDSIADDSDDHLKENIQLIKD